MFVAKNIDSTAQKGKKKKKSSQKAFHLEMFSSAAEHAPATLALC